MKVMQALCPVCEAQVIVNPGTEVSEVISCPDCRSQLVVESINNQKTNLAKAPKVEEDWGE